MPTSASTSTSSDNGKANPDHRGNHMEDSDSPVMTIQYLRARLLSERLVSKAAKDRVEELAKRVEELEEQLEIVSFQRKRAEKATVDILSFLASQGISDISEYESESELDEEGSLCESNEGKCEEAQNVGTLKLKGNQEASCSDHTTSSGSGSGSGRALSWNGRKETATLSDNKFCDSSIKRQARFPPLGSTQRHRSGKSCRQIRRREFRAMVEGSRHEYAKSDAQDNKTLESSENHANGLDTGGEELATSGNKRVEIVLRKCRVRLSLALQEKESNASSPIPNHKYNGDMEKALEHQAQLIGCYEAQEKAQRDWEEKYGDNDISTLDSCEPGNHSDVTEETDVNKESVYQPTKFVACHGHEVKAGIESELHGKESSAHYVNRTKFTANVDAGHSQKHNFIDMEGSRSQPSDFSFSTGNNYQISQTQEHVVAPSFHFSAQSSSHFVGSASSITSSPADSILRESEQPDKPYGQPALVANEEPQSQRVGMILGALEEAKLLIKEQMDQFPETSSRSLGKAIETSVFIVRDSDWLKVPVGCSGLFRVPMNIQSQFPTENRLLDLGYSSEPTHTSLHPRARGSQVDGFISSPMDLRTCPPMYGPFSYTPVVVAEPGSSVMQSRLGFTSYSGQSLSSNLVSPAFPSFPDVLPSMSFNHMSYSPVLRTEAGIPPSRIARAFYHDHDVRQNLYR